MPQRNPDCVAAIPTATRPEMLALTLQALSESHRPDNLDVRIYADRSADINVVEQVRNLYYPEALIFQAKQHVISPSGCWNILNAIKQGYETGAENIFLIEEDIRIRPNFFEFHLSQTDCLASCGRKDPHHYLLYGPLYTNPGSCLRRELVERLLPHINDDYFTRLGAYLDEHFETWPTQSQLDDGLIRRVIRKMGGHVVYPETPVCIHQGFRLYDRIDIYKNDEIGVEKKITRLKEIISSIRPGDRYAKDFEVY